MRKYSVERMASAFKAYKKIESRMSYYSSCRNHGNRGILCDHDEHALLYQRLDFRRHILESWLTDQPINWYFAPWLTNDERDDRNGWSKK